jgi:hypothetical protein
MPAVVGGASLGIASQIPILNLLNCACCALAIGGGFLAGVLYMRDAPPAVQAPYGEGALLGLVTGGIGAVVSTLLAIPIQLFVGAVGLGGFEQLREVLEDSEVPDEVVDMLSGFGAAGFSMLAVVFGFVLSLLFYTLFAAVGALLAVALFHRKAAGPV